MPQSNAVTQPQAVVPNPVTTIQTLLNHEDVHSRAELQYELAGRKQIGAGVSGD